MARQFKIINNQTENAGEAILDIPHPAILQYKSPKDLVDEFANTWGMKPQGVVLPTVAPDGLLYQCQGIDLPHSGVMKAVHFETVVAQFSTLVEHIYLSFDPSFGFVRTDALHIVDIIGNGSAQVCISNQQSQELLGAVLGMGIDITLNVLGNNKQKLAGVVIDVCDILPMGAETKRIKLTCFCESCTKFFNNHEPSLLKKFRTFPNPWNLVLTDSGSGIGYIDNIPYATTPDAIVGLSLQRGYIDDFKDNDTTPPNQARQLQFAKDLLRYIEVRHEQVSNSLSNIFDESLNGLDEYHIKRIVLTEGNHYNWTSGLQLTRFDNMDTPFDEIWFNSTSSEIYLKNVKFRSYMWRRSRYFIDAFWQTVATVSDPVKRSTTGVARLSEAQVRDMLRMRLSQAISTADNERTSIAALPPLMSGAKESSKRLGFVGVALTEEIGQKVINGLHIPKGLESRSNNSGDKSAMLEQLFKQMMIGKDAD